MEILAKLFNHIDNFQTIPGQKDLRKDLIERSVFSTHSDEAQITEIFFNTANSMKAFWFTSAGLKLNLCGRIDPDAKFFDQLREGIKELASILSKPWENVEKETFTNILSQDFLDKFTVEKFITNNPQITILSKDHFNFSDKLYRLFDRNTLQLDTTDKIRIFTVKNEKEVDYIIGTSDALKSFTDSLYKEFKISLKVLARAKVPLALLDKSQIPVGLLPSSEPEEEGFVKIRCANDLAPFAGQVVAFKTQFRWLVDGCFKFKDTPELLFGKISKNLKQYESGESGFEFSKFIHKNSPVHPFGFIDSCMTTPLPMRLATDEELTQIKNALSTDNVRFAGDR